MEEFSSDDDYISDILSSSDESEYISDSDSEIFDNETINSETDYESDDELIDINFYEFKRLLDILHIDYDFSKKNMNSTVQNYNLII